MKKLSLQLLCSIFVLLPCTMIIAKQTTPCPSPSLIRSLKLTKALPCAKNNPYLWCVLSDPFIHQNGTWNLAVIFSGEYENTKVVLKKAQEKFDSAEFLDAPMGKGTPETQMSCVYSTSTIIVAYSPPLESNIST